MHRSSKKRNTIISLLLVAALVITGAFAYLTATDTATNLFTVGNVVVELTEPNWAPDTDSDSDGINDTRSNIVAGQVIAKDPTITNKGDNDAYVYVMVEVPKADGIIIDAATVNDHQLFSYTINEGWELLDSKIDEDDTNNYYLYAYNTALTPSSSSILFDEVIFSNTGSDFQPDESLNIKITGYAIQSDYYNNEATDAETAWNLYATQNDWEFPSNPAPIIVPEGMAALNFVNENGKVVHTEIAEPGTPVEMYFETNLAKTGYTFDWVDKTTGEVAYSGMPMPEEEQTNLTATYTETGHGTSTSNFIKYFLMYNEEQGYYASVYDFRNDNNSIPTELTDIVLASSVTFTVKDGDIQRIDPESTTNLNSSGSFENTDGSLTFWASNNANNYHELSNGTYTVPVTEVNFASTGIHYNHVITRSLVIPDSVINVHGLPKLTYTEEIVFPYGTTRISNILGAPVLNELKIPNSVTYIGNIKNTTLSSELNIPASVTTMYSNNFENCTIEHVIFNSDAFGAIADNVAKIDDLANITKITFGEGVTYIPASFAFQNSYIKELDIAGTVKIIGEGAFSGCSGLVKVVAHEGLETVESMAFNKCSALKEIYLPVSLKTIGNQVIYKCTSLTDIYYAGTQSQWFAVSVGSLNDNNATLHGEYVY